jgi:hypothetical protein
VAFQVSRKPVSRRPDDHIPLSATSGQVCPVCRPSDVKCVGRTFIALHPLQARHSDVWIDRRAAILWLSPCRSGSKTSHATPH